MADPMPGRRARMQSSPGATAPSAPRPGSLPGVVRPLPGPLPAHAPLPSPAPEAARARPLPFVFPLGARIADAYLALGLLAYGEVYGVGLLSLGQFVGAFELGQASQGLVPVALVAAAPCAVAAGAVVELLRHGGGRRARIAIGALAAVFAALVTYGVASGRHFEGGLRVPFAALAGLAGAALAFAAAPRVARALALPSASSLRKTGIFVVSSLGALVAVELANARVLPRLYPAFHLGLGAIAVLLAAAVGLAFQALDPPRRPGRRGLVSGPLVRGGLAAALFAFGASRAPRAA